MIKHKFNLINLKSTQKEILKEFKEYVKDINDAHIIAGAKEAKVNFLITYNLRDFKIDKIKTDFNIIILNPAQFLQYLRSR